MADEEEIMLRRAAEACRNVSDAEWFKWVPRFLDRLAEEAASESGSGAQEPRP